MTPTTPTSRHDRLVQRLGCTGWLYLQSALPWVLLFVALRIAVHSDLAVHPTQFVPLAGLLYAGVKTHRSRHRGLCPAHPPGAC